MSSSLAGWLHSSHSCVWVVVLSSGCARTGDMFQAACPSVAVRKRNQSTHVCSLQVKWRVRRRNFQGEQKEDSPEFMFLYMQHVVNNVFEVWMRTIFSYIISHCSRRVQSFSTFVAVLCYGLLCVFMCVQYMCCCMWVFNKISNRRMSSEGDCTLKESLWNKMTWHHLWSQSKPVCVCVCAFYFLFAWKDKIMYWFIC